MERITLLAGFGSISPISLNQHLRSLEVVGQLEVERDVAAGKDRAGRVVRHRSDHHQGEGRHQVRQHAGRCDEEDDGREHNRHQQRHIQQVAQKRDEHLIKA